MNARTTGRHAGEPRASLRFSGINAALIGLGAAAIGGGYGLLANGSTVVAPLLLVLGYAVLIPVGIVR